MATRRTRRRPKKAAGTRPTKARSGVGRGVGRGAVGPADRGRDMTADELRDAVRALAERRTPLPPLALHDEDRGFRAFVGYMIDIYRSTNGEGPRWEEVSDKTLAFFAAGRAECQRAIQNERSAPQASRGDEAWLKRQLRGLREGGAS
jgi:hypothetical protein